MTNIDRLHRQHRALLEMGAPPVALPLLFAVGIQMGHRRQEFGDQVCDGRPGRANLSCRVAGLPDAGTAGLIVLACLGERRKAPDPSGFARDIIRSGAKLFFAVAEAAIDTALYPLRRSQPSGVDNARILDNQPARVDMCRHFLHESSPAPNIRPVMPA